MSKKMKHILGLLLLLVGLIGLTGCTLFSSDAEELPEDPAAVEEPQEPAVPELTEEELLAIAQEERLQLEETRKNELKEFYVPLPAIGEEREKVTTEAKAVYVTSNVAGFNFDIEDIEYYADYVRSISGQTNNTVDTSRLGDVNKLERILGLCEASELNALVIDVKNDDGLVSWPSDVPIVEEVGSNWTNVMPEYSVLLDYLKDHNIYSIARIVAFKDPYFAKTKSEHAIQLKNGGAYKDKKGIMWVNPFDPYVWDYNIALSKEAALRGFDEIQYDYVRFPDNAKTYNPITDFPYREGRDKDQAIESFLAHAKEELAPYNVNIAADVFGVATRSWDDKPEDIGQTWRLVANQADYICPMIYPSHYGPNWYGYAVPDQHPYGVLRASLKEALERNAAQPEPAVIRPWIQGFNAPWIAGHINYDAKAISDQIVAGVELGVNDYIIWDPSNSYDPMIFFYHDRVEDTWPEGEDVTGRTPEEALSKYLKAQKNDWLSQIYLLTPMDERAADYDEFAAQREETGMTLDSYDIVSVNKTDDGKWTAVLNATFTSNQGTAELTGAVVDIINEKDVYKVSLPELVFVNEQESETESEGSVEATE
ncbi:hypothetical protein JR334_09605 [Clostridia bacterium]|nr:hypothetical protein JR334_09605 [Clostridia bacterium]